VCTGSSLYYSWLRKLREIVEYCAADFAFEYFGHARDRAGWFIEGDALDTGHREEDRRQSNAFGIELVDFIHEMIEGIQVNAAYCDPAGIDVQQYAPNFFFGRMQADDDDRVWFHSGLCNTLLSLARASLTMDTRDGGRDQQETSLAVLLAGSLVGSVQPEQRITQVAIVADFERKPAFT
jgi:hypothetical protein